MSGNIHSVYVILHMASGQDYRMHYQQKAQERDLVKLSSVREPCKSWKTLGNGERSVEEVGILLQDHKEFQLVCQGLLTHVHQERVNLLKRFSLGRQNLPKILFIQSHRHHIQRKTNEYFLHRASAILRSHLSLL